MIKIFSKKNSFSCFLGALVGLVAVIVITNGVLAKDTNIYLPSISTGVSINSSTEEILALMIDSDQKWNTLHAEYLLFQKDPDSGEIVNSETQEFWLSDKGKLSRVEIVGDDINIKFVKDEINIYEENLNEANFFQMKIPETFQITDYNPRELLANSSNVVYLHPYGKVLPTGYYDFLYPTGIAQGLFSSINNKLETISIIGEDTIAGRNTIIIERLPKNHLYWIDCQTGIILKVQYFGDNKTWQTQFEIQSIEIDKDIDHAVFQFASSNNSVEISPSKYFEILLEN